MLQQKYKQNEVITIKLVSGEEVMGYFISMTAEEITLRKPVTPVATESGVGLAPYIMTSDYLQSGNVGELSFNKQTIITHIPTEKQFANAYTKQVSGLDLSGSNKPGLIT